MVFPAASVRVTPIQCSPGARLRHRAAARPPANDSDRLSCVGRACAPSPYVVAAPLLEGTHTASCGCLSCRRTESPHRLQAPLRPAAGRRTGHLRDRLDAVRRSAGPARSANVWPRCVRSPASPTASKSIAYVSPQVVLELGTHAEFIPQDRFAIGHSRRRNSQRLGPPGPASVSS